MSKTTQEQLLNYEFSKLALRLDEMGIKRGTIRWCVENLRNTRRIIKSHGAKCRVNWVQTLKDDGFIGTLRVFVAIIWLNSRSEL